MNGVAIEFVDAVTLDCRAVFNDQNFDRSVHDFLIKAGYNFEPKSSRCWSYQKGGMKLKFLSSDLRAMVIVQLFDSSIGWMDFVQFTYPQSLEAFVKILKAYSA